MTAWLLIATTLVLPWIWGLIAWKICRAAWPAAGDRNPPPGKHNASPPEIPDFQI